MNRKINMRVYKFIILGALNGAMCGLIACYFMDYMVISNSTRIFLTYGDWVIACVPIFAIIGALINGLYAVLLTDEEEVKGIRKLFKRN